MHIKRLHTQYTCSPEYPYFSKKRSNSTPSQIASTETTPPFPHPQKFLPLRTKHLSLKLICQMLLLCCLAGGLVACGPEQSSMDREAMADATLQIAQEYAASQNLEVARQQLAELNVANVNQWLLYMAETHVAEGGDTEGERALTDLAGALGLNSTAVAVSENSEVASDTVVADAPNGDRETADVVEPGADNAAATDAEADESARPVIVVADLVDSADSNAESDDSNSNAENTTAGSAASSADPPVIEIAPSDTSDASDASAEEAAAAPQTVSATATNGMNVRSGPGLAYTIVGAMQTGDTAAITGKNPQGDWWQVTLPTGQQGWVYSPLVTTAGETASIAVAAEIPTPPPVVPTPEPVAVAPVEEVAQEAPVEEVPAEEAPAEEAPAEEAAPAPAGPDFVMIERRLWGPEENGGRMDGESVVCGEKRQLQVHVLDAAGAPLDGVAVQVLYGNKEIEVTGAQGKGDGIVEFILGDGQDVTVIKDTDGREVSSDVARNLSTKPYAIDFNDLIQAGYCTDAASCQKNVVDVYACGGHYSWTVKFQRSY